MDKIICDVCGTSYQESATQCPICGHVKTADTKAAAVGAAGTYQHVKGGRFSSANVRKRNEGGAAVAVSSTAGNGRIPIKLGVSFVLGLVAIILLVIFMVVLGFFIVKLVGQLPQNGSSAGTTVQTDSTQPSVTDPGATDPLGTSGIDETGPSGGETVETSGTTASTTTATESTTIVDGKWDINRTEFTLRTKGETWNLYSKSSTVSLNNIVWTSDDESVATVDGGVVTGVGRGHTKIHAEFNGVKKTCKVHCTFADDKSDEETEPTTDSTELRLSDKDGDVTLFVNGANSDKWFNLYVLDANGNKKDVVWAASKDGIVTIEGSKITAIKKGTVTVSGTYEGQKFECIVRVSTKSN